MMVGKVNIVVEQPAAAFDPTLEEGGEPQIAEREALLRECLSVMGRAMQEDWDRFVLDDLHSLRQRIAAALGQGPLPAPAPEWPASGVPGGHP